MTPDNHDTLQRLWKGQEGETQPSLDVVRARSETLDRRWRRRNYAEYAAGLIVLAFVLPQMWTASNGVLVAGVAALLAGIGYVMYRLHTAGSPRTMPSDVGVRSCVEHYRAALERQRDLLQNIWTWYLLPFWPGMALILIGQLLETPERWPFALGIAVLAVLMAFQIAWMNKRGAKTLQAMIDNLEEDPVSAFQSGPPALTLSQRLSVWFLTSFLGATVLGLVMGRFFPEAQANIPGLSELPATTRNVVFVLVLMVAGVAIQAVLWVIRRR